MACQSGFLMTGAFAEEHELIGHRDQRSNDRVGFAHAISAVPWTVAAGGLHAFGRRRQYG